MEHRNCTFLNISQYRDTRLAPVERRQGEEIGFKGALN